MFGRDRTKRLTRPESEMLRVVTKALRPNYGYLFEQLDSDFILGKSRSQTDSAWDIVVDADLEAKYSDYDLPTYFVIEGIEVGCSTQDGVVRVDLHVVEGRLSAFEVHGDVRKLDLEKVDVSRVSERHFENEVRSRLERQLEALSPEEMALLDTSSTFEIDWGDGEWLMMRELGDGDCWGFDVGNNQTALITHDPFEVAVLFSSVEELRSALKNELEPN